MNAMDYLRDQLRVVIPPTPSASTLPGRLMDVLLWRPAIPLDSDPMLGGESGWAWDFAAADAAEHAWELKPAGPLQERLEDRRKWAVGLPLPQYGLTLGLGGGNGLAADNPAELGFRVAISIRAMEIAMFRSGRSAPVLLESLRALGRREATAHQRGLWAYIEDDLLVTEALFATDFVMQFQSAGDLGVRAALAGLSTAETGEVAYAWMDDHTLRVQGRPAAPLAVRGLRV